MKDKVQRLFEVGIHIHKLFEEFAEEPDYLDLALTLSDLTAKITRKIIELDTGIKLPVKSEIEEGYLAECEQYTTDQLIATIKQIKTDKVALIKNHKYEEAANLRDRQVALQDILLKKLLV